MAKKKPSIIHKKSDKLMKYLKKTKSARYSCTAIRTKVMRTAPWLYKKFKTKYRLKINYIKRKVDILTNHFFEHGCNKINACCVYKITDDNSTIRKDSFSDDFIIIKKLKRKYTHPKNFLHQFQTCNDYSKILTELEELKVSEEPLMKDRCAFIKNLKTKNEIECCHKIKEMPKETIPKADENIIPPFLIKFLLMQERKQFAIAFIFMKHSEDIFVSWKFEVDYKNHIHTEPPLCLAIETILKEIGISVARIVIYTFNSPCWDCMCLLNQRHNSWHKDYGFSTAVVFTKFFLRDLDHLNLNKYSAKEMLNPSSVFYDSCEKCKNVLYRLNPLKDQFESDTYKKIIRYIPTGKKISENIQDCVSNLNTLVSQSHCSLETHLQHGINTISFFKFHQKIQCPLERKWHEVVHKRAKPYFLEQIKKDIKRGLVEGDYKRFKASCGNNIPVKLYHLPLNL
ncbi:uncharacterized protein LOC120743345 isoform X4 [Simochromis diagramma]|uniref:uncharacterized protein LOC120743345 isoform X4 n=1 Tax=Simochromis diagramma TaxID=43689 RepID=UPI001A7E9450|nr:uncharacterized protein LOC120743345 isoform X4 [Simochromis diagramma]